LHGTEEWTLPIFPPLVLFTSSYSIFTVRAEQGKKSKSYCNGSTFRGITPMSFIRFYHLSGAVSGRSRRFPESPRLSPPFISNPYLRTACVPARNLQRCLPILEFTMLEIGMDLMQETKSSVWKCHALCRVNCAQKVIVRRDS